MKVGHWLRVDEDFGQTLAKALEVGVSDAKIAVSEVDKYWAERGRPNAGALPEHFIPAKTPGVP